MAGPIVAVSDGENKRDYNLVELEALASRLGSRGASSLFDATPSLKHDLLAAATFIQKHCNHQRLLKQIDDHNAQQLNLLPHECV